MNYLKHLVIIVPILLFTFGCNRTKPQPPANIEPATLTHFVKYQGESLSIISAWYTGNGGLWRVITESNAGLNPARLKIGQQIKIPLALVKKTEPLPEQFVSQFYQRQPLPPKEVEEEMKTQEAPTTEESTETTPTTTVPSEPVQTIDPQTNELREKAREELLKEIGAE